MNTMKILFIISYITLSLHSCYKEPAIWEGHVLREPRNQLSVEQLLEDSTFPLIDMSYFGRPDWSIEADIEFFGSLTFRDTEILYPINRAYYEGENIFPGIQIDFVSSDGELIPIQDKFLVDHSDSNSSWNVLVGTGKVWQEEADGSWCRASFPLSLTDSYIGQVRNCVATFVYKEGAVSNVYLQSSQETADFNDQQVENMRVMLSVDYKPLDFPNADSVIEKRNRMKADRLPVYPLSTIDQNKDIEAYFQKSKYTEAPTSLGAIILDGYIYLDPPMTRQGIYPYPDEMRHAVYSVSKSMTGALAFFYLSERYGYGLGDELISDYVPVLANHPAWQGVTFLHTLNMVSGTEGSEESWHLYEILIKARSAEEAIQNIAGLGDYPGEPGEDFNYASTNLFVLSYAMQKYVEEKEGAGISYWDMVYENVLVPIGAENFTLLHTVESDGSKGIPMLAYGAWPTVDEVAKIALLISLEGKYNGQQILNRERCSEALGRTSCKGYSTNNDYRGKYYRHSFWSTDIRTGGCAVNVTYMLGYGGNYVWFFPSGAIAIRFMDEYDLDFKDLVKGVEKIRSSCNN